MSVDGINKTSPTGVAADQNLASTPVLVDLLHPAETATIPAAQPIAPAMTLPLASARVAAPSPVAPPQPSPRIAPITPPRGAPLEPTFEMVPQPAPAQIAPLPVMTDVKTPDQLSPQPAPPPVAPLVPPAPAVEPVQETLSTRPLPQRSSGRGSLMLLIIVILVVLLAAGGAVYYFVFMHHKTTSTPKVAVAVPLTATVPTSLGQAAANGTLAAGGTTSGQPNFEGLLATSATSGMAALQVEVEPMGTPFNGTPTITGSGTNAAGHDLTLTATATGLADGGYHWQARTQVGNATSAWATYAPSSTTTADFTIKTSGPATPTIGAVTGGTISGTNLTLTNNQPTFNGKADPGTTLSLAIAPDNVTLAPVVASDGTWSVTPTQALANGTHTATLTATDTAGNHSQTSYTLNVNPVAASSGSSSVASGTSSSATASPSTTTTTKLAPTGDATTNLTLLGAALALVAGAGFLGLRRYERRP